MSSQLVWNNFVENFAQRDIITQVRGMSCFVLDEGFYISDGFNWHLVQASPGNDYFSYSNPDFVGTSYTDAGYDLDISGLTDQEVNNVMHVYIGGVKQLFSSTIPQPLDTFGWNNATNTWSWPVSIDHLSLHILSKVIEVPGLLP